MELIRGDSFDLLGEFKTGEVDAVISDPPYDLDDCPIDEYLRIAKGNVLLFCKPENIWPQGDEHLFWVKTPSTKNFKARCGRFVEIIVVYRQGATFNQLHWSQMTGVYDDRHISATVHPYEKPLSLMERLVRIYTKLGDTVFDPFMGSGTTGVAANNLGRDFVGIEIERDYFKIAERRVNGA